MKKISFKRIGIITLAVIILLIALRFIFYRETLWIGLALLLAGLIAFLVWKAFVKNGREDLRRSERKGKELEEEVTSLKKEIAGLYRELEEKGRSPLNVVELSPILHLAVMNIDSSFVRTFIREDEDAGLTFNRLIWYEEPDKNALLIIRNKKTGNEVAAINLTDFLAQGRNAYDLYAYSRQEYLDRSYDYYLDFFIKNDVWQYAEVRINVLSWAKRIQNVKLK